jgi:hypothetical protein
MPWSDLEGRVWRLADRMSEAAYERSGRDLGERGLYLDLPAWGFHVFDADPTGEDV